MALGLDEGGAPLYIDAAGRLKKFVSFLEELTWNSCVWDGG